jgi:NADPH:quinone reductase-like Zn-dependent oxidoreductase
VKRAALEANGVDHVVIDDGEIAARVKAIAPGGIDALLELVGPKTMLDSFATLRPGARACLTGYLEHIWDDPKLASTASRLRIELERFGSNVIVRSAYAGIFQTIVDGVESGTYRVNLDRTFPLAEIAAAHTYMEANLATGKVVGLTA